MTTKSTLAPARTPAPLAQLRTVDPHLWDTVYATSSSMPVKQALSAALLGDPILAKRILESGVGAWMLMDWPDLSGK